MPERPEGGGQDDRADQVDKMVARSVSICCMVADGLTEAEPEEENTGDVARQSGKNR